MWEGYIKIGLIPSNTGYSELFERSHINAVLQNVDGEIVYRSYGYTDTTDNDDFLIRKQQIKGGMVVWREDISAVNRINSELEEATERIEEENDLIEEENRFTAEKVSYETQNKLYDKIARHTHLQLSAENERLHADNQRLKDLNNAANAKYAQLDHDFAEFYDSVADEVALRDENARLSAENRQLGSQLHSVCAELKEVKTENAALRTKVSEQEQQIISFKAELSSLQRLYAALQERVEKIMRFVEQHKLTKALQEFLGSGKKDVRK